jgi:hypothetical protein
MDGGGIMATTTNYSWTLPTVGGSDNTWGQNLNANWTALDTLLGGVNVTEFAILDGATITTTELNYLSGVGSNIQSQIDAIVAGGSAGDGTITITAGDAIDGGGSFTVNQATNSSITINHADTSSQSSVNNSGTTFIQDITLDAYGHVTAIGSATVTVDTSVPEYGEVGSYIVANRTGLSITSSNSIVGDPVGTVVSGSSLRVQPNTTGTSQNVSTFNGVFKYDWTTNSMPSTSLPGTWQKMTSGPSTIKDDNASEYYLSHLWLRIT